ncbi:MAG: ribonuclease R family protein [Phycisphaeraceae bacterium JB051]
MTTTKQLKHKAQSIMSERLEKRILEHVSDQRYQPTQVHLLAKALGIEPTDEDTFREAVTHLLDSGQVVHGAANSICLPPMGREVIGTFRLNERGFGFIEPDPDKRTGHGDLFVPQGNTLDGMTGDRVRAKVIPRRSRGDGKSPYIGRIVEIIQRSEKQYVGCLFKQGSQWLVKVDGKILTEPVIIRDPHAKNATANDKVVIELTQYPTERYLAEGVIVDVLGETGEPDVETTAVMRAFGLEEKFDKQVMEQAREAAKSFDPENLPATREDLRDVFTLTIDPPDAKDYDDAISLSKFDSPQGDGAVYELGVHIADVSHFVPMGTKLDDQAYLRGNSTYLPRKVIPMLPELLSNGVCSLQEAVPRFTKTAIIRYDEEGKRIGFRVCNAVIKSDKRLTYLEAQALIESDLKEAVKHAKTEPKYPKLTMPTLKLFDELAKLILKRRRDSGMIELGLPDVDLVYDDSGRVIDAQREDDAFTHRIIEMFMVEANEVTAELFDGLDIPMIRRVHPDPSSFDIDELRQFARVAGYNIPSQPTRSELQELLNSVRGKSAEQAVHFAVLKTLSKAEYAPMPIGHFALASEHYTHFTSPIRRYPDLVVHRAIDAYLEAKGDGEGGKNKKKTVEGMLDDKRVPDEVKLGEIGKHCSATERNSEAAERQLRYFLVLQLLAEHLGDDFEGTVTGVTNSGVFMQIDKYLVDGFIRTADLPGGGKSRHGEHWRLNRNTGQLVAQRSGRVIAIGDQFVIRIARVDPAARMLDLVIVENKGGNKPKHAPTPDKKKRKQPKGARKAHQQSMNVKRLKNSDNAGGSKKKKHRKGRGRR